MLLPIEDFTKTRRKLCNTYDAAAIKEAYIRHEIDLDETTECNVRLGRRNYEYIVNYNIVFVYLLDNVKINCFKYQFS